MPDEVGTKATRSDAPSVDDSLFGDASVTDDKPASVVAGEDANQETPQDGQDSDDVENQDGQSDDLKVVVSIKGGWATIGVQKPSADPYIETFDVGDVASLAQEVPAVTERARARWEDMPKHPAYERPAPQTRRRNRRQQGTSQASTAEEEAETEQAQQQTLRLF